MDVLADIHAIPEPLTEFATLDRDGAAGLRSHWDNERRYHAWALQEEGVRIPVLEDAFAWIEDNWPDQTSPDVLCWGDSRVGNIMYDGPAPVGVLDWESAWLAPRELDLGWFVFFHRMYQDLAEAFGVPGLPDMLRRDDVVARYEETSGVEVHDLDFYITYAALRLGTIMARTHLRRMHFGEVGAPDDPNGYVMHHSMLAQLIDGTYRWDEKR